MTTVNNLLKFNNWSLEKAEDLKPRQYDLHSIQKDTMDRLRETMPELQSSDVSIVFEVQLAREKSVVAIDVAILQDALQPLIVNALQATRSGNAIIRVLTQAGSPMLRFDVIDTGSGIPSCDHMRIFQPFEKGSVHANGAGLGLTLAVKAAHLLGGTLELVKSELGAGSQFRIELPNLVFTPGIVSSNPQSNGTSSPKAFFVINDIDQPSIEISDFARHLLDHGLIESKEPEGTLIITSLPSSTDPLPNVLLSLRKPHTVVIVNKQDPFPSAEIDDLRALIPNHNAVIAPSPFSPAGWEEMMMRTQQHGSLPVAKAPEDMTKSATNSITNGTKRNPISSLTSVSISADTAQNASLSPRALLVDDNAINLKVLRMYCEKRGIPCSLATNGQEAVTQFKKASESSPINIVLMDLQMPICGGLEAVASIRAFEAANSLLPSTIFMITGQDSPRDRSLSMEAGSNEFLVKPVSLKLLDKQLAKYHFM